MKLGDASLYTDFQGLGELKAAASRDADGELAKVAKQFESLFIQQMLKSMRQANLGDGKGLMDSDQSLFYRDMYDQQLSIHLAESGGMGLADVIIRQLQGQKSDPSSPQDITGYGRNVLLQKVSAEPEETQQLKKDEIDEVVSADKVPPGKDPKSWSVDDFVEELLPWASEAAGMIGIQPQALLAQAALETGWGKHMMARSGGGSANNLFGIKADSRWDGEQVKVDTLEYEEGIAVKKRDHFRAYEGYRQSFLDYVDFLRASPRYSRALEVAGDSERYFAELQQAGYATDPKYAYKINSIMAGDELKSAIAKFKVEAVGPL